MESADEPCVTYVLQQEQSEINDVCERVVKGPSTNVASTWGGKVYPNSDFEEGWWLHGFGIERGGRGSKLPKI